MKFRVVDNLHEDVMNDFISYLRYTYFEGDLAQLYLEKNFANQEARNKKKRQNNLDSDDDEVELSEDVFNGCQLKF